MSERDNTLTEEERALTSANLALAAQFIDEYLDDPDRFGDPPEGAAVVLMPADDPALAAANLAMANRLAADGRRVVLARVGVPASDHSTWDGDVRRLLEVRTIRPRWAPDLDPGHAAVVYDAARDVLLVDLAGGRRRGRALPVNESVALLVDIEPQEAFGYVVPGFLAHAVRRAPRLAQVLSLAAFRSLSPDELGGLDVPASDFAAGSATPTAAVDPDAIDAFVRDIELLSA